MLPGMEKFFAARVDHPLADERELRRVLAELPADNAFRAADEIAGWLESLQECTDFPVEQLFPVLRQLDEAAQPALKKLARDYLHTPRLSKNEEKRLWTIVHAFWMLLAENYFRCFEKIAADARLHERLQAQLPLLGVRLLAALASETKWEQFHYGPTRNDSWQRMGQVYLAAEAGKFADRALKRYPAAAAPTSVAREYLKALVFHASSLDCLLPLEIELAERLIAHLLPGFVLTAESQANSVYWVDPAAGVPPCRLASVPKKTATLRFFHAGTAGQQANELAQLLERGLDMPPEVDLGGQYPARLLLPVLRHLDDYWRAVPPQRVHQRHRVKHRMAVLGGLVNAFVVFSGGFGIRPAGLPIESWVVEDVSRGGFGAVVEELRADWLRVGALLALQPEGGENWLLGAVRRYQRDSDATARAGIETLARQVVAVEMTPRAASSYAVAAGMHGLWLQDGNEPGEARLVMAVGVFDIRESLEFDHEGRRHLLTPLALVEQTQDYELARYRILAAD